MSLFLAIFDPHSSTFKSVFDCRLPGVELALRGRTSNLNPDSLHQLESQPTLYYSETITVLAGDLFEPKGLK